MTRRNRILKLLKLQPQQTCAELTKTIARAENPHADSNLSYLLNDAVLSVLREMLIAGEIRCIGLGGPRFLQRYCLK